MKNRLRIGILLVLLLLFNLKGNAQSAKLLTIDKGLSNSLVNQMSEDHYGFIWIATEDGLNMYDGNKTVVYRSNFKDAHALRHDYVEATFEDRAHRLFVGHFCGLQRYDYANDCFYDIPMCDKKGKELQNVHVVSIIQRKNGDLIIATSGHGLFQLQEKEGRLSAKACPFVLPTAFINSVFEDRQGRLWVSTLDKGLLCILRNGKTSAFFQEAEMAAKSVCNVCEDESGVIYVGLYGKGVYQLQPHSTQFVSIPLFADCPVRCLALMKSHELYVGTDGKGLKVYRTDTRQLVDNEYYIATYDLHRASVHHLLKDRNGNIWIGFYQKGVVAIPQVSNQFQYIGCRSNTRNIIGQNYVMTLLCDVSGTLWVGTDNDGLYKVDARHNTSVHYAHTNGTNTVPATITSLFEDSARNLWIGSFTDGLSMFNKKEGTVQHFPLTNKDGVPVQRVYDVVEDEYHNLWVASMGDGLFRIDATTKKVKRYRLSEEAANPKEAATLLHNGWIASLAYYKGNLYLGTCDGLACLNTHTDNLLTVFHKNNLFPGLSVNSLEVDKQGTVWIGSSSGLIRLGHNLKIKRYTVEDGLPNNVVSSIVTDAKGNLWISTNNGISQFSPETESFINYYSTEGNNEYAKRSGCISSQGDIYFGGIYGVTHFSPKNIMFRSRKPIVLLTEIIVNDSLVHKGMKSGSIEMIDTSVMETKELHLSANDNSFTLGFSTLDFTNSDRVVYQYSMNDTTWLSLRSGVNRISYSKLAPGTYHFKVRAKDGDLYSVVRTLHINIAPPWYASVWAKLLYALLFVLFVALAYWQMRQRYHNHQRMVEQAHAQEIQEAKLQFFMNIAHEIRTPMTLIISPLRKLMNTDKDEKRQAGYELMNRNAERIIQLVNQLMDMRKIDKGQMVLSFSETDLVAFVRHIVHSFDDLAQNREIDLSFESDVDTLPVWLDPAHFDKVVLNLLSNALKFTKPHGKVWVNLKKVDEIAHLTVWDNGVGIDETESERIFERFYQIRNSQSKASMGTGIGLHLTRLLVELHHGHIHAENHADGVGCSFIVEIPVGDAHLQPEEMQVGSKPQPMDENTTHARTRYKVLLVEDDEEIRRYVKQELSQTFTVTECENGKEALASILHKAPDLVITDVMMPEMDGLTLCKKIKQNVTINSIPVVLLTAKATETDNIEGLSLGADAFIAKPFNIEILRKTAENLIKNREALRNTYSGTQEQEAKLQAIQLNSPDEKLMTRIMNTINKNMGNTDLNVEMIAGEVGVSRVHLYRKLKELTNQTPSDFIRNTRLRQAAKLLAEKHQNVTEVADAVGFVNKAHFSTSFKELFGVSPTEYMKQQQHTEGV